MFKAELNEVFQLNVKALKYIYCKLNSQIRHYFCMGIATIPKTPNLK